MVTFPVPAFKGNFVTVFPSGLIIVAKGYGWDGATKTLNPRYSRKPALEHDILYELIQKGVLPASARKAADLHLKVRLQDEGMPAPRALAWYTAVRLFGGAWSDADSPTDNQVVCL